MTQSLRESRTESARERTGPAAVVRFAGSPVSVLEGLRGENSWAIARELVRLSAEIDADRGTLSDLLHARIGAAGDGDLKARLVAVRRAVHRGRRVDPAWLTGAPADLAAPLRRWSVLLAERDRLQSELPEQIVVDWAENCEALRDAARLPAFQTGLVHASPDTFLALHRWTTTGRAPQRQTILRLAQYLARSAAKTSPYSTFTSSGLAAWDRSDDLVVLSGRLAEGRFTAATSTEVSIGSLHRIARAVIERPEIIGRSLIRVNPSVTVTEDALVFLGRRPAEHVHSLALTPTLRRILDVTIDGTTLDDLRGALHAQAGAGDQADVFLRRLVTLGVLELVPPLADQTADPVADLRAWLRELRTPGLERLDRALQELQEALSKYPAISSPGDRVAVRDSVVRGLDASLREAGDHAHVANAGLAKEFARYSFYENAVHAGTVATLDRERWQPLLEDLDAVRVLLGLIGPDLPTKLALSRLFQDRYPPGTELPVLVFYQDVLAQQQATGPVPAGPEAPDGERPDGTEDPSRELRRLRAVAKSLLGERAPDPDGVVRVDPDEVRKLAREWPSWVRTPTSVAAYCQLAETETGPELVVNAVNCGFGRGRNRVRQIMDGLDLLAGAPAESGLAAGRDGLLFAEFEAVARSAVNVRKPAVGLVVDYPGVRSAREPHDRLPINDLYVRLGGDGLLRLESRRTGKQICPVHPGLGDRLLPPMARFMVEAFGESNTWFGAHTELRMTSDPRADQGMLRLPRLMVGSVLLRRAIWMTRAGLIPRRTDAATDAAWMLRIASWLAEHGIPERCFITVLDPVTLPQGGSGAGPTNDIKPNYLDFASMLLLRGLERRLTEPNAIVQISEMVPDPSQLSGDRVTEYIVELNEPGVTYV
jgi:hypothetical protein